MTPERWQQIQDVLEKALELAPDQRSGFLDQACSSDPSLRQEVETLLASGDGVRSSFLESSALRVTLTSGTKLGEYEVKSVLGSGGMGEVYRARDSRLGRDVAIKVLPSFLSTDSERLRRFEQEARAAAALNHPNILAVFQMGTYEGAPYLVSELLEGETLREQIKRGRLSVRKVIDYGVQIARGLAAAHEKGIIHRDLKPENLFVTKAGRVKILDFGMAKLTQPQSSSQNDAPTLTEGTEAGVVMGTVGYMAPEQVRGQRADHRADIFAFGAILYEMLAGKSAFQKLTSPDTMSAILNEDPPGISQVVANISPAMQRVVHRCLEKNPEQRFQSASDLAFALDALSETSGAAGVVSNTESRRIPNLWMVAAALVAVIIVALALRYRTEWRPRLKQELVERQLTANRPGSNISSQAISRDGKFLAYGDFLSKNHLHLLAIDTGEIRDLPIPIGYEVDDWFPDGNHLLLEGDLNGGGLWKVSTWDFSLRKLWTGPANLAAVSPDGSHIAFVNDLHQIWLMGVGGEDPHQILASDAFLGGLAWSPTGQRLAYSVAEDLLAKLEPRIETSDLAGGARTVVLSDPHLQGFSSGLDGIAWLPDGRIVYGNHSGDTESSLCAIKTDPSTGKRDSDPSPLAGWKDLEAEQPHSSADGKHLIAVRRRTGDTIYVGDLVSGSKGFAPHRFLLDDWSSFVTAWTQDSRAIFFDSRRNGKWAVFKQDIDGKTPETLISGPGSYFRPRVTADGRLLYTATASTRRWEGADPTIRLMSTPLQGGPRSTLMMGRYDYRCSSSPSSSCVVSDLKDIQLTFFHLDPLKGRGEEIASIGGYKGFLPHWDLSPDGSKIAIVYNGVQKGEIRLVNLADRSIAVLRVGNWRNLQDISWAADGNSLFAVAFDSSVCLLSVDAKGTAKVVSEIPADTGWISSIVPSPDGKHLAFTKRVYAGDVILLENF